MLKIAITGPESVGKSTLCQTLAQHFGGVCVAEYARSYIAQLTRRYRLADILHIAQTQYAKNRDSYNAPITFCDTELLVTKIWAEHAFGKCPDWIVEHIPQQKFDLYLLPYIDLAWEYDEQREHPHLRSFFWQWYEKELQNYAFPYAVVQGQGEERLQNAINSIQNWAMRHGKILNPP